MARDPIAGEYRTVEIDRIRPARAQARRGSNERADGELRDSIREAGLLQPPLVREVDGGDLELVAGERRWRAAREASLTTITVAVVEAGDTEAQALGLIENLQRVDLTAVEKAEGLLALKERLGAKTWTDVAKRLGIDKSRISQLMKLAELPDEVKVLVYDGKLNEAQARAIEKASDTTEELVRAAAAVVEQGTPARGVSAVVVALRSHPVEKFNSPGAGRRASGKKDPVRRLKTAVKRLKEAVDAARGELDDDERAALAADLEGWARDVIAALRGSAPDGADVAEERPTAAPTTRRVPRPAAGHQTPESQPGSP